MKKFVMFMVGGIILVITLLASAQTKYPPFVTPITSGPKVTNKGETSPANNPTPIPLQNKVPDYIIDHFPTGKAEITPEMIPVFKILISKANANTDKIELQGWTSGPLDSEKFTKQRELANDRTMVVANMLITNGVPANRIIINSTVGKGLEHPTDNFRNQKVDVYFIPAKQIVLNDINIACPPGYKAEFMHSTNIVNDQYLINLNARCIPTAP
jgi:hypothetical protein